MSATEFRGFAGAILRADIAGSPDDPAVLLLHGGGQTRKVWGDVADALVKAGRHVINLDLRGHGESERPADKHYEFDAFVEDVRAVLSHLPSRPVIVAASMGGWIATVVLGESGAPLASGLVLVDAPPLLDAEVAQRLGEMAKRAAQQHSDPEWDPDYLAALDHEAVMRRFGGAVPHIKVPTLYVRGERSRQTSHEAAEAFVSLIGNAELVEVEDTGQLIAPDRLDLFNAVLLEFLERKHPRAAPEYVAGSDPRTLRDAMGCFATGVTVVTAMGSDGRPIGLTANSFTSVSLDPPLLLVCVARSAGSRAVMENSEHFGVNVLHIGQQPVSNLFASRVEDRFAEVEWAKGEHDVPILLNSLAAIECVRHAVFDGGDHVILVGRVERARFEVRRDPLLYFSGKYRRLHFG
jgi:flavin reductase (DIM6/NTAB) family NADH-FMN oxidoreductase RutF/pimeloyl-ACP methyl ester carboxylesterase